MKTIIIAFPLPPIVQKALQRLCYGLPQATWTAEQQFHVALFRFRKVDGNTLLDIKESIARIPPLPQSIALDGVGSYWNKSKGGTVWVNVQMNASLEKLLKEIPKSLKETKLEPDDRIQKPHVLLATCAATPPHYLAAYLEANAPFSLPPFEVDNLVVLSSLTTDKNIIYYLE